MLYSINIKFTNNIPIAALIMTGGYIGYGDILSSVEVYVPSTNTSCSLPSLPVGTWDHSQDGLLQCGGIGNSRQCLTFHSDSGEWRVKTHRLSERRVRHSSWQRDDGTVLLMGGVDSPTTTEIVSDSSAVSTPGFSLKYKTA